MPDFLSTIGRGVKGVRIGIDRKYAFGGVDAEIKNAIEKALRALKAAGAIIVPFKMPPLDAALAAWGPICSADAATGHAASYPSKKRGYSGTFGGFLNMGHAVTGLEYANAEITRRELRGNMESIFTSIDLMIKPVYQKIVII